MTPPAHPLLDHVEGAFACTESRSHLVFLSEGLADFLGYTARRNLTPVIITAPDARLTYPATYFLELSRALWVLRTPTGFIDTRTGERIARISDLSPAGNHSADLPQKAFATPAADSGFEVQVLFGLTVHHNATIDTRLGEAAECLSRAFTGKLPGQWGSHEPALVAWDRDLYTAAARSRMPGESRYVITGQGHIPFHATSLIRRTDKGIEESLTGITALSRADSSPRSVSLLPQVLVEVANTVTMPVIGSLSIRRGRSDLTTTATSTDPGYPVAGLIGPRAVRDLGARIDELQHRFRAIRTGRPRIPSLVVPFTDPRTGSWDQLAELLTEFGDENVRHALGFPRHPDATINQTGGV
ncbi:hypothetical protein GCM10022198_22990 [Klugiella xanthotipulae]|uniref:Uncharacterized protein n=1 Tax=Klugiella xanthotipulae TaxID=244735 RepID=A0A543I5U5_9MICO|nr:DUF6177 family protein [Klugiella xanthotipulae]TQM65973.1 hypothetical protein FB466_0793 [Klugiella xanthotipulae]